jgi:hypothetical protein
MCAELRRAQPRGKGAASSSGVVRSRKEVDPSSILVLVNLGLHAVQRTPFHLFKQWVDQAAKIMAREVAKGHARYAYKTSGAVHEYGFHYAASDPPLKYDPHISPLSGKLSDPLSFARRRWRLSDARIALFDGYAVDVMQRHGIPAIDHYWLTKAWPKIAGHAIRASPEHKYPSFDDNAHDMRHYSRAADLAFITALLSGKLPYHGADDNAGHMA